MKRLDIPFNIDLLTVTEQSLKMSLGQVKSLDVYQGATKNFHPDGLYSTEIFGVAGTEARVTRFGYIDLRVQILHPLIVRVLGKLKGLYLGIMAGKEFAVWDDQLKDFVKSNGLEGQTGYQFFMDHWEHIEHEPRTSAKRQEMIALINKKKQNAYVRWVMVIPAGLRDMEVDEFNRETSDEINSLYYRLIANSNTIAPNAHDVGIEAYNSQRMSMQNAFIEVYNTLSNILDGKHGLVSGKWAARRLANGTRNVIVPMHTPVRRLGQEGAMGLTDTSMGIYQTMKATLPVSLYLLKNGFLRECFTDKGAPVWLCNPETLQSERVEIPLDEYDRWMSNEGLEKLITYFGVSSIRNNPVKIGSHYLGLLYRGPDGTFRICHGIEELPEGREAKDARPITIAEFFYCSIYRHMNRYPVLVTRYPVTEAGSVVDGKVYLRSTLEYETRQELDEYWNPIEGALSYQFPISGSDFYNAMAPHPSSLPGLGADHDGDTTSADVAYSDESIREMDQYLKTTQAYVGGDGNFTRQLEVDTVAFTLRFLTGK